MKKRRSAQHGFTLVEVIVVAVIVAVLAAVGVPIYLRYTQNSMENQANNIAAGIGTFCHTCSIGSGKCRITRQATLDNPGSMRCDANTATITIPQEFRVSLVCEEVRIWSLVDPSISSRKIPLK